MSRGMLAAGFTLALAVAGGAAPAAPPLRVCADPNNMPFSRADGAGFENRIAQLVAAQLGRRLEYVWRAQRRGFLREGLKEGRCDFVAGVPARADLALTTRPYYRSTYVFVTRAGEPPVSSFDDPSLRTRRIGVQLIGDDGANTPPAHELAWRGVIANVRGFPVYGDYARPDPPAAILEALRRGEIDVAAVWGPLAGYFASRTGKPLVITPVDQGHARLPQSFAIAMGVTKGATALAADIQKALDVRRPEVEAVLARYHVPVMPAAGRGENGG